MNIISQSQSVNEPAYLEQAFRDGRAILAIKPVCRFPMLSLEVRCELYDGFWWEQFKNFTINKVILLSYHLILDNRNPNDILGVLLFLQALTSSLNRCHCRRHFKVRVLINCCAAAAGISCSRN